MAYAFVNSATSGPGSGLTSTVTLNGVTAGNLLIVFSRVSSNNRSVVSMSSPGNTWSSVGVGQGSPSNAELEVWYAQNAASGNTTVTVTYDSAGATTEYLAILEYSGILTSGALDKVSSATNFGVASLSSGTTATTTQANELVIAFGFTENASRPIAGVPSGFAQRIYNTSASAEYMIADLRQTSTATQSVTFAVTGGNSTLYSAIATFKETAGVTVNKGLLDFF